MRKIPFLLLFFLTGYTAFSQTRVDTVFHYVFPEFQEGLVYFKSGGIRPYLINYNTACNEMVYLENDKPMAITNTGIIDSIVIANRNFQAADVGFKEQIIRNPFINVYVMHRSKLSVEGKKGPYGSTLNTSNPIEVSVVSTNSGLYKMELEPGIIVKPYIEYEIKKGFESKVFTSMRQINQYYDHRKDMKKEYTRKNRVRFTDVGSVKDYIEYLEGLR